MHIVTSHLFSVITKQVEQHGTVVWFDPELHYRHIVPKMDLLETTIAVYDGSFFALRHQIDPLLHDEQPPRLLVYVPLEQADIHNALVELTVAGVVCKPGQQPPTRNTRLSIIARNALKGVMSEEAVTAIEKQVEEGKLNLAELDALADKGKGIAGGVIVTIYGTSIPDEVALAFLTRPDLDQSLLQKKAVPELQLLLQTNLDITWPNSSDPSNLRQHLARHLLATELRRELGDELLPALASVPTAVKPAAQETCQKLAQTWRLRRDLRQSYMNQAAEVAQSLNLGHMPFTLAQLRRLETFLPLEEALQQQVETTLLEQATPDLVHLALTRQSSFWSEVQPEIQARWALIATAGQVLLEATQINQALLNPKLTASELIAAYASVESPWCELDTQFRHMERRYHNFDFGVDGSHESLNPLITKARQMYMDTGATLTTRFLEQLRNAQFQLPEFPRQTQIYTHKVQPLLNQGKTAYVWVDALRFEMGRELAHTLAESFTVTLEAAVATVPTITEIGMAALLPHPTPPAIVPAGSGKLALQAGNTIIKNRPDRVKYLRDQSGVPFFEAKLNDLLPKPKKDIQQGIENARLILITSQEIDALCEGDNIPLARRTMDGILHELGRAFQVLVSLGVQTIIVTADHGYLFGEALSVDMKIDPPGGNTVDLHRRVWVGQGGAASDSYLRARVADFGLGGDLEIAVPWTFAAFKVKGGANAYFHGGLSLQELVIPILTLQSQKTTETALTSEIVWTLEPGSAKISTRFYSVQVKGASAGLFNLEPPKVRLEIRAKGQTISEPVSASYGFEEATGNVMLTTAATNPRSLEPDTITLMITEDINQKTVAVHLFDATSGVELARLDKIEVAISL
jgi:hypothetical protein